MKGVVEPRDVLGVADVSSLYGVSVLSDMPGVVESAGVVPGMSW